MQIEIDLNVCAAYANCTFEAPDVFAIDDASGKATVILDGDLDARRDEIERAAESCPVQAIVLRD